jgi:hypothetical protein
MLFSSLFSLNQVKKLERQAKSILELPKQHKAFRLGKEIVVVDCSRNKIVEKSKDVYPSNHLRASFALAKKLNLIPQKKDAKRSDVWTCGFRDSEARWVWYLNSEPVMTASFREVFKNGSLEDKTFFYSARYGTSIINRLKEASLEKISKELNALVLENPFVKVKCSMCSSEEHYTIDDLVDASRVPSYESNYVVCQNCNELVKLS